MNSHKMSFVRPWTWMNLLLEKQHHLLRVFQNSRASFETCHSSEVRLTSTQLTRHTSTIPPGGMPERGVDSDVRLAYRKGEHVGKTPGQFRIHQSCSHSRLAAQLPDDSSTTAVGRAEPVPLVPAGDTPALPQAPLRVCKCFTPWFQYNFGLEWWVVVWLHLISSGSHAQWHGIELQVNLKAKHSGECHPLPMS